MDDDRISRASRLTDEDKGLIGFVKDQIFNAIDKISDFSKSMIPLVTGFFAAYFALLKFLGLGENIQLSTLLDRVNAGIPPFLFIISIIAFIISYTPYILVRRVNMFDLQSMRSYRRFTFLTKYVPMIIGVMSFILGLAITLQISIELLLFSQ